MFRIALAPNPDIHLVGDGDGEQGCTIDLHPLRHTTDRWRDYPVRLGA
jgi:hypothetical protein